MISLAIIASIGYALPQTESSSQSFSTLSDLFTIIKSSGIVTLSLGPIFEGAGNTQTFYLTSSTENTYSANHNTSALIDGEIFLGVQKVLRERLDGQIGLAVATTGNAPLSGNIWSEADVQLNNYTYNYSVNHTHVALKGKLLFDNDFILTPCISGSLGIGFNHSYGFNNTPTIYEAVAMSNFSNNTTTAFTYTLGIGVERTLSSNWQMGVGYEFADWGKSQLGVAAGQTLNTGLSLSHLYTNGLLFNLTYLV